jgi:hypothetical protein
MPVEIWKAILVALPQGGWIVVAVVVFFGIRRQLLGLLGSAKVATVKLPGGVEFALTAKEATEIVQDLTNDLETLSSNQVRLLFRLIRLKAHNTLSLIPSPDHNRATAFHNALRILREGHLVHGVDSNGESAGRFRAGRLVDLFPWALKLPDLAQGAKTSDGKTWRAIRDQVAQETVIDIKQALNQDAVAPPPNQALQRTGETAVV